MTKQNAEKSALKKIAIALENPRKTNQVWREIWGSFCHLFPTLTVCETKCVEWGGASPWGNSRDSSGLEQTKGNMHVNKFTMKATKDVDKFAVKIHYMGKTLPKTKEFQNTRDFPTPFKPVLQN